MTGAKLIERTPWDCAALGMDAWELAHAGAEALAQVSAPGHYTVKVDPLASTALLHRNGFYYCDTLIEPYCAAAALPACTHEAAGFERRPALGPLIEICRGAFRHGRFHRDFNVGTARADLRYENWLASLHAAGKVYGLRWEGALAGFIAHDESRLVLHALAPSHRGRGLARHLWSAVCADLARGGAREISSSVSASNLAAVNLYAALGFRFRNPIDVYHRVVP